ncbi:complex I subunit 5 family protein [Camelimonas sp. ID_303_24]
MVAALFHPLGIFLFGLGGGFALPLLYRLGKGWLAGGFFLALCGIVLASGAGLLRLLAGEPAIEVLTAGAMPPVSINMRLGLWEAFFAFSVNVTALLGALHLWDRLRGSYGALLLYLILVMGIDGMIMTRDLFNLFVFLEIASIATYGLLGLSQAPAALAAAFKYIMATVVASSLFLVGSVLLYHVAGTLNIDELIAGASTLNRPMGVAALLMLLAGLLIELKPFPANGWGLDVYETAPGGIAAMVSVGVSAGVFFALFKLSPLFGAQLGIIAFSGAVTFLLSNLIGLSQTRTQRLLGYSSIGQMGLMTLALGALAQIDAAAAAPLVIGGLFVNHLLAKAGLFWLAETLGMERTDSRAGLRNHPLTLALLGLLIVAIAGLPPFPGFWAKWELVMRLTAAGAHHWTAVILIGSLLEAAYMFRWFGLTLRQSTSARAGHVSRPPESHPSRLLPPLAAGLLLLAAGGLAASMAGVAAPLLFAPLLAGAAMFAIDGVLPGRLKAVAMELIVLAAGVWLLWPAGGIAALFAGLLLAGGVVIAAASLRYAAPRPGFYPLMTTLLLAIMNLLRAQDSLSFFFSWELITLASYFLIARSPRASRYLLSFLLFSLAAAYFLMAGFATVAAAAGGTELAALRQSGGNMEIAFILLVAGFLIKAGVLGAHVWLPGSYAESEDDVSAMLSAVVSKVAIYGLLLVTYLAIRTELKLEAAHVMAWVGLLTVIGGALMALRQQDFKRLLACSSMSQIGYIIIAIALMSHLGWVTALYLVANHLLVKGILFLGVAGVIARTGARRFVSTGGLVRAMPLTFAMMSIAVISMSGLPPLMGFGGKWLLLTAMLEQGWRALAIASLFGTFLGFLYMIRLIQGLFTGPRAEGQDQVREASIFLLAPQALLVVGIIVLSLFPKLLFDPVSAAIDPQFAAGLVWEGMSLEKIYAAWNPTPALVAALAASALLFAGFWIVWRRTTASGGVGRFYAYYRMVIGRSLPPVAVLFWDGVATGANIASNLARRPYTGNGQTYVLYVMYYFLAIYVAGSGLAGLKP